jgi:dihydroflavonol-4-reductase
MKALVTGATGLIGNAVAKRLVGEGHEVGALVRDAARAGRLLPPEVRLVPGDITDPASLREAVRGVEVVFHAAGIPEQWQADESIYDRVNRRGTANVLATAAAEGVRRVVYTSSMIVFEAPPGGTVVESRLDTRPKETAYGRSKQAAENETERFVSEGLDVVLINPSVVYGPSPVHVGLNSFFIQVLNGKAPLLPPGGMSVVYVDGVASAHVAAAGHGRTGERYLVSDGFVRNVDLAREVCTAGGPRRVPPTAPAWFMRALASASEPLARTFRFRPLITRGQLSIVLWRADVDAGKAERELGFSPTPLSEGVRKTVDFLRAERLVRSP